MTTTVQGLQHNTGLIKSKNNLIVITTTTLSEMYRTYSVAGPILRVFMIYLTEL